MTTEANLLILFRQAIIERLRVCYDQDAIDEALVFKRKNPGFETQGSIDHLGNVSCTLCNHFPNSPYRCVNCKFLYCRDCAFFMVNIELVRNNRPTLEHRDGFLNENFTCINRDCKALNQFELAPIFKELKDTVVNCIRKACNESGPYEKMVLHVRDCTAASQAPRISINTIPRSFLEIECKINFIHQSANLRQQFLDNESNVGILRFNSPRPEHASDLKELVEETNEDDVLENLMENFDDEVEKFRESEAAKEPGRDYRLAEDNIFGQSSSNEGYRPSSSLSERSIEDEPCSSRQADERDNQPKYRCIPAGMEDDTSSKTAKRRASELGKMLGSSLLQSPLQLRPQSRQLSSSDSSRAQSPDENPEANISEFRAPGFYSGYREKPAPKNERQLLEEGCSELQLKRWRFRQNEKEQSRQLSQVERRKNVCQERLRAASTGVVRPLPKMQQKRIREALEKLGKKNFKVCAIDIEKCEILRSDGSRRQLAVWVSIIDGFGMIKLNTFIRHPRPSISNLLTEFHDLTWEDIKFAPI